jgi:nucleoid-associated protein YgaU
VAAAPKMKVVSRGDSLWRISRITYGDGTRYAVLYRANRDRIRDPNVIRPGQILLLPMKGR